MTIINLDSGGCALLNDSGMFCLHTSTLLGPLSISDVASGAHLFIPNDMISCIMWLPGLCACLPGDSVLRMWFEGDKPDLMCLDIKETHVGPVCHKWNVDWFKWDTIRIQLGSPVVIKVAMNIGNDGLYDIWVVQSL